MNPASATPHFASPINDAISKGNGALASRLMMEKAMCEALVTTCVARGYAVSVNDGCEWVLKKATDANTILQAMFSTDEDRITIRDSAGEKVGSFYLVYGNDGFDVIADHTDNEICNNIWNEALRPLAEAFEKTL